jgi:serine protease AprX
LRYAIMAHPGIWGVSDIEAKVKQYGGRDLRVAPVSGQVFCDMDPEKAALLAEIPGLVVRPVHRVSLREMGGGMGGLTSQMVTLPQAPVAYGPMYSVSQTALSTLFFDFRMMFDPPVTGQGFTIAVLDSGIRKTHLGLKDKVVYEANLSEAASADDVFDHGTGVAYIAAGGKHGTGEDSGMAPGAGIINLKCIGDDG